MLGGRPRGPLARGVSPEHRPDRLTFDPGRTSSVTVCAPTRSGEVAERSGFSASSLRYYEGIGLVEPMTRTDAGYRLYDDGTLDRLSFIARAKELGCSLEEITDLVSIWDGDRCGPVQRRFHDLVTAKIADSQRRIAELVALAAQLQVAAAAAGRPGGRRAVRRRLRLPRRAPPGGSDRLHPRSVRDGLSSSRSGRTSSRSPALDTTSAAVGCASSSRRDVPVAEVARLAAEEQRCCRVLLVRPHRSTSVASASRCGRPRAPRRS